MCWKRIGDPRQIDLEDELSEYGLTASNGPTGPPSPSGPDAPETAEPTTATVVAGVKMVRHHKGRATISTGFLRLFQESSPATFIASREGPLGDAYMVTLSLELDVGQWAQLLGLLTMPGENVSVVVAFDPTTPNLAPSTTAPST